MTRLYLRVVLFLMTTLYVRVLGFHPYDPLRIGRRHHLAIASASRSSELLSLFPDPETPLDESLCPSNVQNLAKQCLLACVFLDNGEAPISAEALIEPNKRLHDILRRCCEVAPALAATDAHVLPLARLAAWLDCQQWQRPLSEWNAVDHSAGSDDPRGGQVNATNDCGVALRSLAAHLVEKWDDVPEPLRWALSYMDGPPTTEAAQVISHKFFGVYVQAGGGAESVKSGLQRVASPKFSKQMAKHFVQGDPAEFLNGESVSAQSPAASAAAGVQLTAEYEDVMALFGMGERRRGNGSSSRGDSKSQTQQSTRAWQRLNPLVALRYAQVKALVSAAAGDAGVRERRRSDEGRGNTGKELEEKERFPEENETERASWLLQAVLASKAGATLAVNAEQEAFLQSAIQWAAVHADALGREPSTVTTALNYLCEVAAIEGPDKFSVAGRTPKSVQQALEAYEVSSVKFDDDELFQPNPVGINGMFRTNATIPAETVVYVPYDGNYSLGGVDGLQRQPGSEPVTVRILEIDSLKRLVFEGQQLGNCLENKLHSQVKYVSRARQRISSFWSMTLLRADGTLDYECLIEVW